MVYHDLPALPHWQNQWRSGIAYQWRRSGSMVGTLGKSPLYSLNRRYTFFFLQSIYSFIFCVLIHWERGTISYNWLQGTNTRRHQSHKYIGKVITRNLPLSTLPFASTLESTSSIRLWAGAPRLLPGSTFDRKLGYFVLSTERSKQDLLEPVELSGLKELFE